MTIMHGHAWLTENDENSTAGHALASTLSSQIKGWYPGALNPHLSQGKVL